MDGIMSSPVGAFVCATVARFTVRMSRVIHAVTNKYELSLPQGRSTITRDDRLRWIRFSDSLPDKD